MTKFVAGLAHKLICCSLFLAMPGKEKKPKLQKRKMSYKLTQIFHRSALETTVSMRYLGLKSRTEKKKKKDIKNLERVQKDLVKWETGLEGMS